MNFKEFYTKTENRLTDAILSLWATGDKEMQDYFKFLLAEDPIMAESGDMLASGSVPGLTSLVGEKLTPLQEKIEKVAASADVLINNMNEVLDAKSKANLRESIAKLNSLMDEFSKASKNVNAILDKNQANIDGSLANLNKTTANFSKISDTLAKAKIGKAIKHFEHSLSSVDNMISGLEKGKGSMGKLLNDDELYKNLNSTSTELELLLQDLRLNPTRYINVSLFGKKNKPYIAPKPQDTISTNSL